MKHFTYPGMSVFVAAISTMHILLPSYAMKQKIVVI